MLISISDLRVSAFGEEKYGTDHGIKHLSSINRGLSHIVCPSALLGIFLSYVYSFMNSMLRMLQISSERSALGTA